MTRFARLLLSLLATTALIWPGADANAAVRLKDIADFEGARDNLLIGYGLVVGLQGSGDDLTRDIFTRESLIGMLERLGVNARDPQLRTKNVAAVMVTATLRADARQGTRIDINVSAAGGARPGRYGDQGWPDRRPDPERRHRRAEDPLRHPFDEVDEHRAAQPRFHHG